MKVTTLTAVSMIALLTACASHPQVPREPTTGIVDMTGTDPVSGITPAMQAKTNAAVEKPIYEDKSRKGAAINTDPVLRTLGIVAEAGLMFVRF